MNQIDLSGKVAVVTGGGRGIGLAIAQRMARSGARLAVWDNEPARIAKGSEADKIGAAGLTVDVSDADAVARAVAETEKRVGPIDILVNSAAIGGVNTTVAEYPVERMARRDRRQPDRHVPHLPRGRARHAAARLRADRQHRVDRRQGGQSECLRLFGLEGRRHLAHQVARQGTGDVRRSA